MSSSKDMDRMGACVEWMDLRKAAVFGQDPDAVLAGEVSLPDGPLAGQEGRDALARMTSGLEGLSRPVLATIARIYWEEFAQRAAAAEGEEEVAGLFNGAMLDSIIFGYRLAQLVAEEEGK